ncbi:hypothetical protein [Chryseobacterium gossypii]|uniref:hypothetical protein n=1 Tax=Chryseobacterium gossypii TaxID=3231602 RepID=UPI0035233663
MRKRIFTLSAVICSLFMYSQVGINTPTPQKNLHVNGSLQVTNELNVGGNASTAGSAGTAGQMLISNGPGTAPSWTDLSAVSGQSSIAFNVFSTGRSINGSTTFNPIPGLAYSYTAPANGKLIIQANIYTALYENPGSFAFTNTQIAIRVNGTETLYGMSTPFGSTSAGQNPVTTGIVGQINLVKGQTYNIDTVIKDVYTNGSTTGSYGGTFVWSTYSSPSSILAIFIAD